MLGKKVFKDIQSLSLKKHREETGMFIAEGPKVVEELLQIIPMQIEAVYATAEWQPKTITVNNFIEVSDADLARLSQQKTANRVVAVVKQFASKTPPGNGFTLYLDAVQDPGNFGTIIRIADWFGVANIVCSRGCADLYNAKVVQSTMASIARVNVFYDEEETWLKEQKQPVYAAALEGKPLYTYAKVDDGVLIIGNESKGIREEFLALATDRITIERRGEAESLNAAVATGILLSHLIP